MLQQAVKVIPFMFEVSSFQLFYSKVLRKVQLMTYLAQMQCSRRLMHTP